MYKCRECGTEYEVKPDYCDCGNDTFDEVNLEPIPPVDEPPKRAIPTPPRKNVEYSEPKAPSQQRKRGAAYDYSKIKNFFDPLSTILFLFCIAFAMYITTIGYDFNKPVKKAEVKHKDEVVVNQNIPGVDAFWDNTGVSVKQVQSQNTQPLPSEPKIVQIVEQVFKPQKSQNSPIQKSQVVQQKPQAVQSKPQAKQQTPQKTAASQTTQKQAQPTKSASQTSAPVKTSNSGSPKTNTSANSSQTKTSGNSQGIDLAKIVNNNKNYSKSQSPSVSYVAPVSKPSASSQSSQPSKAKSASSTPQQTKPAQTASSSTSQTSKPSGGQSQTAQTVAKTEPKPVDPAVLKQELSNYKIGLRNTIGKKIDFTRVVGDGECSLSFSLDSSGRLLNRKFTKQSTNVTLNDVVFAAMNSTTRYNPPPAGYKNETLNLNIRFYNGNFSISLN